MKQTIGEYLLRRLEEAGVKHIFGVPGDYNLELMQQLEDRQHPVWVGNCNELNASYAADGYARMNGLGALIVTHGVGALSAMNGIAGAYSEHVPVVCICGSIPQSSIDGGRLMHHTMADGSQDRFLRAFTEVTVAQAKLTPENAAREIDRLLRICWRQKRPVYLELPSDIGCLTVEVPESPLSLRYEPSDEEELRASSAKILARLEQAARPAFLLDMDADRFAVANLIERLADHLAIPVVTLPGAKGTFPETSALFAGVYAGAASSLDVRRTVEDSDCLLTVGYRRVDSTSAFFTDRIPSSAIALNGQSVTIGTQVFQAVYLAELIERLIRDAGERHVETTPERRARPSPCASSSTPESGVALTQTQFWQSIQDFLCPGDVVVAEDGTSSAGLGELKLPEGLTYIVQPIWGSIGFSVGCFLGTLTAARDRRQLLFVGDGSFQLTAQELSTVIRNGHKPYVFLLNNGGYTIERTILGRDSVYNDVADWDYPQFARSLSRRHPVITATVRTKAELDRVLAAPHDHLTFIEVVLSRTDAPLSLIRGGHAAANIDFGPRGPQGSPGAQIQEADVRAASPSAHGEIRGGRKS